jgi:predicted RNase H-like HicB family nuclease
MSPKDDYLLLITTFLKIGVALMLSNYTAKYTKISSGYMAQLIEWPEVITEGKTLAECRKMLQDALHEMILAYRQQNKEMPIGRGLLEQIPVEL